MRVLRTGFAMLFLVACGGNHGDDGGGGGDACVGLECQVVNCAKDGKQPTTLTGTVYAPNGTLPLYGVDVYVPRDTPLPPLKDGAQCARCSEGLPGSPIALTRTDDSGTFRLENVPSGDSIPLVITTGKWRRQITISRVESCVDSAVPAVDTRMPKNKSEGDLPKIAVSTGGADALECLIRKLGVDDTEVTTDASGGRVHLYQGNGVYQVSSGGSAIDLPLATTLWGSVDKLKSYDIVLLSCEGNQHAENKSQEAMNAMKAYADLGGRVFASHWHNVWIQGALSTQGGTGQKPPVWTEIATWTNAAGTTALDTTDLIDEASNPKGTHFAQWMLNVGGSTLRDEVPISTVTTGTITQSSGRNSCNQVNAGRGERWTYLKDQGGYTQNFQFTTPNEMPAEARCGKVVFSDMHVSGIADTVKPYPASCPVGELTPQEKALAFMFFDIAGCVGPLF